MIGNSGVANQYAKTDLQLCDSGVAKLNSISFGCNDITPEKPKADKLKTLADYFGLFRTISEYLLSTF